MPSSPRALLTLLVMSLWLLNVGCASQDRHVFVSTVERPTTISLIDVYQNQSVWDMDIPVNHKLVLNFKNHTAGQSNKLGQAPSWVAWKLYRSDDQPTDTGKNRKGMLVNQDKIDLTGTQVRMQITYRPAPEMPGSVGAAPVPTMETAESVAAEAAAEARAQAMAAGATEQDEAEAVAEKAEAEEAEAEAVAEKADAEEAEAEAVAEKAEAEAVQEVAEEAEAVAEEAAEAVEEAVEKVETEMDDATK